MNTGENSKTAEPRETAGTLEHRSMALEVDREREARQALSLELHRTKTMTVAMAAFLDALSRPDRQPALVAIKADTLVGAAELLKGIVDSIDATLKVAGV